MVRNGSIDKISLAQSKGRFKMYERIETWWNERTEDEQKYIGYGGFTFFIILIGFFLVFPGITLAAIGLLIIGSGWIISHHFDETQEKLEYKLLTMASIVIGFMVVVAGVILIIKYS